MKQILHICELHNVSFAKCTIQNVLIANVRQQGLQLVTFRSVFQKGFQLGEGGAQQIANFPYNTRVRGRSMLTQSKRTLILNISSCIVLRDMLKQS